MYLYYILQNNISIKLYQLKIDNKLWNPADSRIIDRY